MPIRPEQCGLYPRDWPAISAAVRARAGNRCEWLDRGCRCQAMQYAVGHWMRFGREPWTWRPTHGNGPHDAAGQGLDWPSMQRWTFAQARQFAAESYEANPDEGRPIVIVLTVAHLDHQPGHCDPSNLRAWCQRHHLAYDQPHHAQTAFATRRAAKGTLELFPELLAAPADRRAHA